MKCQNCGHELDKEVMFCEMCGNPTGWEKELEVDEEQNLNEEEYTVKDKNHAGVFSRVFALVLLGVVIFTVGSFVFPAVKEIVNSNSNADKAESSRYQNTVMKSSDDGKQNSSKPMELPTEEYVRKTVPSQYFGYQVQNIDGNCKDGTCMAVLNMARTAELVQVSGTVNAYYEWDSEFREWNLISTEESPDYGMSWNFSGTWSFETWMVGGFGSKYIVQFTKQSEDVYVIDYYEDRMDYVLNKVTKSNTGTEEVLIDFENQEFIFDGEKFCFNEDEIWAVAYTEADKQTKKSILQKTTEELPKQVVDWKTKYREVMENTQDYMEINDVMVTYVLTDINQDAIPELLLYNRVGAHMLCELATICTFENGEFLCISFAGEEVGGSEYPVYPYWKNGQLHWLSNLESVVYFNEIGDSRHYVNQNIWEMETLNTKYIFTEIYAVRGGDIDYSQPVTENDVKDIEAFTADYTKASDIPYVRLDADVNRQSDEPWINHNRVDGYTLDAFFVDYEVGVSYWGFPF